MRTHAEKLQHRQKGRVVDPGRTATSQYSHSLLRLQRTIGNQAVQGLIHARLQTKLAIYKPGDEYEQEADRAADQVMRMHDGQSKAACACDGACPKCATSNTDQERGSLQTRRVRLEDSSAATAPPIVQEVISSTGQRLDPATRGFMESRFGHDFGEVQIHTDARARQSARSVNALSYTVGPHVVFGSGMYAPATGRGRQLLAHELAHVVQQRGNTASLQRMLACPARLQGPAPPGWKPYHGDSSVFHCGFTGILEDRRPTRDDPQNECFYDHDGTLVDEHHPFSGCRGTPNQYDSSEHPILHTLIDSGGIVRAGAPAFAESRMHDVGSWLSGLDREIRRLYGAP